MSEVDKAIKIADARLLANKLSWADRARLMSQGFMMNFSDEFFAGLRALGDETYEEAVADEREKLKKAQSKEGSLKYEIGGAVLPALALTPFTGGGSLAATGARYVLGTGGKLMTQGAIQGGTSAVGRQEGNIVDRITENPTEIGLSAGGGALLNPLLQKAGGKVIDVATKTIEPFVRKVKGQLSKPVEDEVARIARASGLTTEEIIERVGKGQTIPELSTTAAREVRGFYVKGMDNVKPTIAESLITRRDKKITDVFATLQKDLSPKIKEGNVFKFMTASENKIKQAASKNYDEIYEKFANFKSNKINLAVEETLNKIPAIRGSLRSLMTALGKDNPFEIKDGVLTLTKDIDLKTAEKLRGLLKTRTTKLYRAGGGPQAETSEALEKNLRNIIDEASPELSMARETWRRIRNANTQYNVGKNIFSKPSDEVEVMFEKVLQSGDQEALESFRAGVSSAIRGKKEGRSFVNFINNVGDLTSKESLILQKIYPDESLDNIIDKVNLAKGSIMAKGLILNQSATAETVEAASRVGSIDDAYALTRVISSGGMDMLANIQLLKKFIPQKANNLNNDQMQKVAELLVTENKQLLRNALTNNEARDSLLLAINRISDNLLGGVAKSGVVEGTEIFKDADFINPAFSDEINPSDYKFVEDLADSVKPETKDKILKITVTPTKFKLPDGSIVPVDEYYRQYDN
jgi:hypothetical protein